MKINKAIRYIMKQKGMSLSVMGSSLRKTNRKTGEVESLTGNDVSARLNNDNLSFDKAVEMLNVLGYEIVLQEKKPGSRRSDQIVINQQNEIKIDLDALLSDTEEQVDEPALTPTEESKETKKTGKKIKLVK